MKWRRRPRQFKDFVLLCNLVKTLFPLSNHQTSIITVVACKTCALSFQEINKARLGPRARVLKPQIRLANVSSLRLAGFG